MQKAVTAYLDFINRTYAKHHAGLPGPATCSHVGGLFTFHLPHVFGFDSSTVENAKILRASLDFLIYVNQAFLKHNTVAPLYQSGVRYDRTMVWDSIPALYNKGFGDCKSLTAALIAEYRAGGVEAVPNFRFVPRPDRGNVADYHILVQTLEGYEDPSKVLGMPQGALY